MRLEDLKVGMKVVPIKKTTGSRGLDSSVAWRTAKERFQPYLYVTDINSDIISLSRDKDGGGDYFHFTDFVPYTGMINEFLNGERVAINCKTEEQAKELFKFLKSRSVTWCSGRELKTDDITNHERYKENTCYDLFNSRKHLSFSPISYYEKNEYKIVSYEYIKEELNMSKMFAKSDFKSGMVIELRNGDKYMAIINGNKDCFIKHKGGFMCLSDYNDKLEVKSKSNDEFDIMKIYSPREVYCINTFITNGQTKSTLFGLLWERKDNSKEIEALRDEIKKVESSLSTMKSKLNTLERER